MSGVFTHAQRAFARANLKYNVVTLHWRAQPAKDLERGGTRPHCERNMRNSKGLRETLATIDAQPAFINAYLKRFKTSLKGGSHHCALCNATTHHSGFEGRRGVRQLGQETATTMHCIYFILHAGSMFRWKHTERRRGTRACERKRDSVTHGDSKCIAQCDNEFNVHCNSKRQRTV